MKRRMFCLVLILMMLSTGCALGEETKNFVIAGYDNTQFRTWAQTALFETLNDKKDAENENVTLHFDFRVYTKDAEWKAAKAAMTPGSELPDALFKASLTTTECMAMYENGVLIDLSDKLESCCPNLWALMEKYPEVKEAITLPGGQIVALPYIKPMGTQNYIWINQAWLDNLGLKMPSNKEDFEAVLRAFKEKDPNKNGKRDEIPVSFLGPFDVKFLAHAYGLVANDYNIYTEEDQVKYLPLDENFRPFLEWCITLWQDGLLDANGFSTTSELRKARASQDDNIYGVLLAPIVQEVITDEKVNDYTIMTPLLYRGERRYRDFSGKVVRGTFAITSACEDPEAVLRWVDQMYTAEGYKLMYYGLENVDYRYNSLGKMEATEAAVANQLFPYTRLMSGGTTMPGIDYMDVEKSVADNNTQKIIAAQESFGRYTEMPFPYFSLTAEQNAYIAPMQYELGAYVDTMIGRFIMGDVELNDENYQQFIDTLYEMNVEDFLAFWQEIYNER